MVLVTQDVGQHREALAFLDQAHGDASDRPLQRNARIHQRERGAAHRRHRGRAVGLGDLGDDADGVGELVFLRQQRMDGAPGELAVTDFATARRAHAARLAHRIGREVVVQHEVLLVGAFQRIDELLVFSGAERGNHQRLGFAAGEQRRAVRARQDADFRDDRAHRFGVAAVDALAGIEHRVAHHLGFHIVEQAVELILRQLAFAFANELLRSARAYLRDLVAAQMLFRDLESFGKLDRRPMP